MTHEQFIKAQDIYEEQCFILQVTGVLESWKDDKGRARKLAMIATHNEVCYKAEDIYSESNGYSAELQKRLLQVCQDYYQELVKEFDEI